MASATLQTLGFSAGASYASGLKLYLTVAVLGLLQHFEIIRLPSSLSFIGNTIVIAFALILCVIEFFFDKIPYVGSAWNAFHVFIRVPAAALLSYGAFNSVPEGWRVLAALLGGGIGLCSYSAKMALRTPVEASPEPFRTMALSLGEDGVTAVLTWFAAAHPVLAIIAVVALLAISVYIMVKLYRALRLSVRRVILVFRRSSAV